jgi:hypothetical protein
MSEEEVVMSKQELEEKLDKTQVQLNTYQAAVLNKMMASTNFRLDIFENVKKKVNSGNKNKNKKVPKQPDNPLQFVPGALPTGSDDGHGTPGSFSSFPNGDDAGSDGDPSLSRRQSRREKKPITKVDLGYEEPKPIKGVKLTGSAKEIFRKCEETLITLRDEFSKVPEFLSKAPKFDQEIKRLRDGQYKNTMMLGNSVRKYLNNLFMVSNSSPLMSTKVASFVHKFEENFAGLDNKVLFEESKIDVGTNRKKSGVFGGKKKMTRTGSRSNLDMDRAMSDEEKKALSRSIRNLTAPQLKGIIKIVKDMFPEKDGMLEFDIDNLPPRKCRELEEYVRKARNPGKKPSNTPTSAGNSKKNNRQNSRPQAFPGYKGQGQPRGNMPFGPGGNKGVMGSMHQPGLVDPNSNLMGGNKMLDESSDSDSKSSNSSIGSQDNLGPDLLQRKAQSHLPNVGGMNEQPTDFAKQNSTGDLYNMYQNKDESQIDSIPTMKKFNSEQM